MGAKIDGPTLERFEGNFLGGFAPLDVRLNGAFPCTPAIDMSSGREGNATADEKIDLLLIRAAGAAPIEAAAEGAIAVEE